jgi:HEAT repeat protein
LSIKDRAKKAEELKAKKKGADDKWKKREEETQEETARLAAIEATYVTDAAAAKKIDDALKATAGKSDWIKASATATSALAQRGDKAAIGALVKLLSSPKKEAREIALHSFGARYDLPEAFLDYVGRKGVVADASVPAALFSFVEGEPKEEIRTQALLAIGAVRSFL